MALTRATDLKAVKIYRGLSIYKVRGSQYWYLRLWDSERRKYTTKGTGETSKIEARKSAIDFARGVLKSQPSVEAQFTFKRYAIKTLTKMEALAAQGQRHIGTIKAIELSIQNTEWGLLRWFGNKDVRKITTRDYSEYMADLEKRRPDLTASTKGTIMSALRNVLKVAQEEGAIDNIPATPKAKQKDNPRPFFRFHPVVTRKDDAYRKLLKTAREMAQQKVITRGIPVTDELYDIIVFLTQSFVRPIGSDMPSSTTTLPSRRILRGS